MLSDFTVASSSFENYKICTTVNLKRKLVARHTETKQRTGSYQNSARYYDAMASHRIGVSNHRSSRLGKDTKVAKTTKLKRTNSGVFDVSSLHITLFLLLLLLFLLFMIIMIIIVTIIVIILISNDYSYTRNQYFYYYYDNYYYEYYFSNTVFCC